MIRYFTSDTHFWHKAIVGYCHRPFESSGDFVQEMNNAIIQNWNSRITESDEVYFLGDFAFCGTNKALDILKRLKGIKFWIKGNHDHSLAKKPEVAKHFKWIRDYYTLRVPDTYENDEGELTQYHQPIVLFHFPILSWDGMAHGAWHLHGHCHGSIDDTWNRTGLRMDVGVDTNKLLPYSYEDIKNIMALRTVTPIDHHK